MVQCLQGYSAQLSMNLNSEITHMTHALNNHMGKTTPTSAMMHQTPNDRRTPVGAQFTQPGRASTNIFESLLMKPQPQFPSQIVGFLYSQ